MATAKLPRADLANLPPVCTHCGEAATDVRVEEFTWTPQWAQSAIFIGLLPLYILVKLTQRRVKVPLPVCDAHRVARWTTTQRVVLGGMALCMAAAVVGCYLMTTSLRWEGEQAAVYGAFGLMLLGLVAVFVCNPVFRATHISDDTVTLDGVSDGFRDAVEGGERQVAPRGGMELQTAKYFRMR